MAAVIVLYELMAALLLVNLTLRVRVDNATHYDSCPPTPHPPTKKRKEKRGEKKATTWHKSKGPGLHKGPQKP